MIDFSDQTASVDEFLDLRKAAGLKAFSYQAASISMANMLHGVWLRDTDGALIGMGRLIGDGGCFVMVVDIAVRPAHQRQGYGQKIMDALLVWADAHLPSSCYLTLIADPRGKKLYERSGFSTRTGMVRLVP